MQLIPMMINDTENCVIKLNLRCKSLEMLKLCFRWLNAKVMLQNFQFCLEILLRSFENRRMRVDVWVIAHGFVLPYCSACFLIQIATTPRPMDAASSPMEIQQIVSVTVVTIAGSTQATSIMAIARSPVARNVMKQVQFCAFAFSGVIAIMSIVFFAMVIVSFPLKCSAIKKLRMLERTIIFSAFRVMSPVFPFIFLSRF